MEAVSRSCEVVVARVHSNKGVIYRRHPVRIPVSEPNSAASTKIKTYIMYR